MREIVPAPPAIIRNQFETVRELYRRHVVPSYTRFDLALDRGCGSEVWDAGGRRYLDLGGGIAVCCLGHAHPEIAETIAAQSRRLVHASNLYYTEPQGRFAAALTRLLGPGRIFCCNSGAEANEGLYKLARRFGHAEGRFEILTTVNSFHGRTLAGIAATGQDKVRHGFGPLVPGFRQVPFNDLEAVRAAFSPATAAVLVEGVQGEGGITLARSDYLLGLRALCDEKRALLLMDGVQCGHFRTGRFQSYQRILEGAPGGDRFTPDGVAMAKSLGNGFPLGAFWVRERHADLLGPGSHGSTYGGTPLACAVGLKVIEIIERDRLAERARELGAWIKAELEALGQSRPEAIREVRGLGFMLGLELAEDVPGLRATDKSPAIQMVERLQQAGVLTIPAGARVVRLLPALNLTSDQAAEGVAAIRRVVAELSGAGSHRG